MLCMLTRVPCHEPIQLSLRYFGPPSPKSTTLPLPQLDPAQIFLCRWRPLRRFDNTGREYIFVSGQLRDDGTGWNVARKNAARFSFERVSGRHDGRPTDGLTV